MGNQTHWTVGQMIWTCRQGFEQDLVEELQGYSNKIKASIPIPSGALVTSTVLPHHISPLGVAFARQGFLLRSVCGSPAGRSGPELVNLVTTALRNNTNTNQPLPETKEQTEARYPAWSLHVWVPDSDKTNPLAKQADTLEQSIKMRASALDMRWADRKVMVTEARKQNGSVLAHACMVERNVVLVGDFPLHLSLSMHPGGRARMHIPEQAPSRAAMKLEEALDWFGFSPQKGDRCVDLGASPGGWTYMLLERGAHVIAIDPGAMAESLRNNRRLEHIRASAFDFEPDEPVDWLFCDMVWRPLEVVALLSKWGRRRWAQMLVANVKLPMKKKAEFVQHIRKELSASGWNNVRIRQLYHDREEVTLCANAR